MTTIGGQVIIKDGKTKSGILAAFSADFLPRNVCSCFFRNKLETHGVWSDPHKHAKTNVTTIGGQEII
jgi:hypothetical protein